MEYFSLFVIGLMAIALFAVLASQGKSVSKYSDEELTKMRRKRERWIQWYKSLGEKKQQDLRNEYLKNYCEMLSLQIEHQKLGYENKNINFREGDIEEFYEVYVPLVEREIELIQSGIDPEEARRKVYAGTPYGKTLDILWP